MGILRLFFLSSVVLLCATLILSGQTNPEPYDLSQGDYEFTTWNADQPAGTYPPNMMFHRGPTQDPDLDDEPNDDYTGPYNATRDTRMNGHGDDGFSWFNTGTAGNLGAAVLAINTNGFENILVSWTGGTVVSNPRPYRVRLQYRVGTSGDFQDVPGPIEYVANTSAGHSQNFGPTLLPDEVNDQEVVQLRWKYYQDGSGSGGRPRLRVGNIHIQTTEDPGSGTGEAIVSEEILQGGTSADLDFTISGTVEDVTLTDIDIVFPEWAANLSADNITLSQEDGVVSIDNTTVTVSDVSVTITDDLVISVTGLELPDVTERYEFIVRTGADSPNTVGIAQHPTILIYGTPMSMIEASQIDQNGVSIHLGEWITIRGVITVADEFRTGGGTPGPSYLQDDTGGFAVFSPENVSAQVSIGDEVTLVGRVTQFFGLNQLDESAIIAEFHSSGNEVTPMELTIDQIMSDGTQGVERYEGVLAKIIGVTTDASFWNVPDGETGDNYNIYDQTGEMELRVNNAVDFVGDPAPPGMFDVVGVVGQYRPQEPLIGGYQLLPRFSDDIIFASDAPLIVSAPPYETSATDTSITFSWSTDGEGIAKVRYGLTDEYELGKETVAGFRESHSVTVTGLDPATIYNVQLLSIAAEDTVRSGNYIVTTRSPVEATQQINVYFNQSVDHSLAAFEEAIENRDFRWHLWSRLHNAEHSVDLAFYSISGDAGRDLRDKIIDLHNNGVQVRVIMDEDRVREAGTGTTYNALNNAGVPVIMGGYNYGQQFSGLHHNKFAIIDYYGGEPDEVWLITSSWNATDIGTHNHRQNMIEFQDVSIAGAYTREFEQMWGSSGPEPDLDNAKFGPEKDVVNPTVFWIDDAYIRLLFSPQGFGQFGSVEEHIIRTVNEAEHSINFGLNLITRSTIADAMHNRFTDGIVVRGVIGDPSFAPSLFNNLASWGDVHEYTRAANVLLHHKYAIFDGENTSWDSKVLTGSHNWSRAANERNDENTLIIHSPHIANLYMQEFAQRYVEAGGEDDIIVSVERDEEEELPQAFTLHQNYPNPFNNETTIRYSIPGDSDVTLTVYNLLGQEVKTLVNERQISGTYNVTFDESGFPSGVYFYRIYANGGNAASQEFVDVRRMVLMK